MVLTLFRFAAPFLYYRIIGDTPSYNLPVNRRKVHRLAPPLELFTALKGSAAPLVRTTTLNRRKVHRLATPLEFRGTPVEKHWFRLFEHDPATNVLERKVLTKNSFVKTFLHYSYFLFLTEISDTF